MAKQVVWSFRAQDDKKNILKYWRQRNKSNSYSKKLNQLFKDVIQLIVEHPFIGKRVDGKALRVKVVRDYLVIYEETETQIWILSIWDARQDPNKLETIVK